MYRSRPPWRRLWNSHILNSAGAFPFVLFCLRPCGVGSFSMNSVVVHADPHRSRSRLFVEEEYGSLEQGRIDLVNLMRCWNASAEFSVLDLGRRRSRTRHRLWEECSASNETGHFLDQTCCSTTVKASFSTEAKTDTATPTEAVQELYDKILKSVEARTMPPNAWLRTMFASCINREDVKLLFEILQKLRIFRLSNLRIHDNFNSQYCMQIAEACARAGALDLAEEPIGKILDQRGVYIYKTLVYVGQKVLWKHNIYGITPTIGSAHYLLLHAKEHNDAKAMVKILQVMKRNSLQFQPTTADIVFSICHNVGDWDLICKLAKKFIKSRIKLHRAAYDIWMDFAAKMGKVESIWEIEELRSKSGKQHTVPTAFACVKGYLLQHQPENAAATIHLLSQSLPDAKKPSIQVELQKLVTEWISSVKKHGERKEFSARLKSDVSAMVEHLLTMGPELDVNIDDKPVAS